MPNRSKRYRRPRFPGLVMIVFLLALGGAITLATAPFFPNTWTNWITAAQNRIGSAGEELAAEPVDIEVVPQPFEAPPMQSPSDRQAGSYETYDLVGGPLEGAVKLVTLGQWSGSGDRDITLSVTRAPWVVWWETNVKSALASDFVLFVDSERVFKQWGRLAEWRGGWPVEDVSTVSGKNYAVLHDQGEVTLRIRASGMQWKVKAGREP